MQITEKQKQQLIDLNDSRVNEILELGLKVGEWYKKKDFGKLMFYFNGEFSKSGYHPNYGINYDGIFSDTIGVFEHEVNEYYEATHQEVAIALIKEAKRRGFKKGVKFKDLHINKEAIIDKVKYHSDSEDLRAGGYCIYYDGKWAEIIDEKAGLKQEIEDLENKLKELKNKL